MAHPYATVPAADDGGESLASLRHALRVHGQQGARELASAGPATGATVAAAAPPQQAMAPTKEAEAEVQTGAPTRGKAPAGPKSATDASVLAAQLELLRQQHQPPREDGGGGGEQLSPQQAVLQQLQQESEGQYTNGRHRRSDAGAAKGGAHVESLGESTSESAPADQRVYPATLDASDPAVRPCTFDDIGSQTQYAWYEHSFEYPLLHAPTGTKIFLHSVCPHHASSIETVRFLNHLVRPAVVAFGLDNSCRTDLEGGLRRRHALGTDRDDVKRIADGYHRVCLGSTEPSELNPTRDDVLRSYARGRALAREYGLLDAENDRDDLKAEGPRVYEANAHLLDDLPPLPQQATWRAMFESGLKPMDHMDVPLLDSLTLKRRIDLIDPPVSAIVQHLRGLVAPEDEQRVEEEEVAAQSAILYDAAQKLLPRGVSEDLWTLMAVAVLYPRQLDFILQQIMQQTPHWFEMLRFRAATNAQALDEICARSDALTGSSDRHVLVIVDRWIEPVLRALWDGLMERRATDPNATVFDKIDMTIKNAAGGKRSKARRRR